MNELKQLWTYEYGGVQKRSVWSKIKLVFNTLWFLPVVALVAAWVLIKGEKK